MNENEPTVINSPRKLIINRYSGPSGGAYGLGFLGALVYYFQNAVTLGGFFFGFIKAIFWPAILVYHLFGFLHL